MADIFNGIMRGISSLLGLFMVVMGGIWILQGFNIAFLGSFMANDKQWALWGALLAAVGVGQIVWSNTHESYYKRK
jgi:hypothetical protein